MTERPWEEFAFRLEDGWAAPEIFHICHLKEARRIFEDGLLISALVNDEPSLSDSRTRVLWISPNDFDAGSYFGNVRFSLPWEVALRGRKLYWVRKVPDRKAVRFFLTDQDASSRFVPYDPTGPGPLTLSNGVWYRTKDYFVEIMLEDNLSLGACHRVSFVDHESCVKKSSCARRGWSKEKAGATLLSTLLGNKILRRPDLFFSGNDKRLSANVSKAWDYLVDSVAASALNAQGLIEADSPAADALVRGIFHFFGRLNSEQVPLLSSLFRSSADLRRTAARVAVAEFKLADKSALTFRDEEDDE